ncbi:hypothetical protein C8F04DRAFT_1324404 [Mycena alexandri]|uniref:NAD-dependent epimerase/dehydratase domain-containing protein n=1 Tax=Mycena alexandri TaxID=1745969 RepID=A0AAD6X4D3_9AGAR|nr:hypothetical protein C8F04DRAFT_1324404 [Mycena alexandri]
MSNTVLITGAAGFLGSLLAEAIAADPNTPAVRLILVDMVEPKSPKASKAVSLKADLTAKEAIDTLFRTEFGVNFESVRLLLQAAREFGAQSPIKFIFTSSLAVYGGPLPETVTPDTIATPEGAYGMEKLASELFINEFSRRGFVDGRILRLPTICVRPGVPAAATSAFISGIIREPLKGIESLCPIGNSIDSPELDLPLWLASPETTIKNFVIAKRLYASKLLPHTRVVCLPGFTATVRDELKALETVGGKKALDLVKFKDDPVNRRLVSSWPPRFDNTYPLNLGFLVDEGGMEPLVRRFQKAIEAGNV